jgi:ABC-type polysaccharide/polyol phosphate export permease
MLRAFGYWILAYCRTWRSTVVVSVANPLLFLLGVGAGLGRLVDSHAPAQINGVAYAAFFAPGMLAAASMQTAFLESAGRAANAASQGTYRDATPTPLEPAELYGGHLLFIAFRVASSSLAFVAVMAAFRLCTVGSAGVVLLASVLTGLAFAAPAAAWGVTVRHQRQIQAVFRFVILPLYMFSGTFFAVSQLPRWLRDVAYITPLWQGVELCRTLALRTATPAGTAVHVAYLLLLAIAGIAAARVTYRRRLHA